MDLYIWAAVIVLAVCVAVIWQQRSEIAKLQGEKGVVQVATVGDLRQLRAVVDSGGWAEDDVLMSCPTGTPSDYEESELPADSNLRYEELIFLRGALEELTEKVRSRAAEA